MFIVLYLYDLTSLKLNIILDGLFRLEKGFQGHEEPKKYNILPAIKTCSFDIFDFHWVLFAIMDRYERKISVHLEIYQFWLPEIDRK